MASKHTLQLIRTIVEHSTKGALGFENILNKVKVTSGGGGACTCEMQVAEEHQNRAGTLHGGMTCTLVDAVSTWALLGTDEPVAGVSVDLSVSFMRGAKVGDDIIIDAKMLKRGKRLAFLTVDITNKLDGNLLAQGKHTKYIG
ncbi:acyl-coenzyme A thioesterase 13-like [Ruditapes philippinarum]|uniref:acyl-coenzyme A thioesterase 13-like n=1 Tax=Ruditapes philippinarum TaxID=129788 RepID=UPI00295B928F|nr:acyl-coenzyme A thioesterase 13-like [Ruditapes philippinarum]